MADRIFCTICGDRISKRKSLAVGSFGKRACKHHNNVREVHTAMYPVSESGHIRYTSQEAYYTEYAKRKEER